MTKIVATLDSNNRLIGTKSVADDADGIDPGDLPLDGRYKYDADHQAFIPLGHGFGKVKTSQPHSNELVIRSIIEALGTSAPNVALEWAKWYDQELRRRDEEFSARPK